MSKSGITARRGAFALAPALALALVAALLLVPVAGVRAQDQNKKKDVVAQQAADAASVRQQIRSSGMTPEQIRERLPQPGLSPTALDAYFGQAAGGSGGPELAPGADVLAAVAVLGEADKAALDAATTTVSERAATIAAAPSTIDGLPVFGLKVFRGLTNQFEPNLAGPVDANYQLGALDVVAIIATGQVELSHTLEVTRDGFIVIPNVGQVFVANMPLARATQVIVQRMRQSYSGAGTEPDARTKVFVTVVRLRTNQVFVLGDVVEPGSIQVSAAGTALSALYAAGGPTTIGSMRAIKVLRGRDTVSIVDTYDYFLRGDASRDVRLQNGDRLFVPPIGRYVSIVGEVLRPGVYELTANETLAEVISNAGGFKPAAARNRVQVSRILPPAERAVPGGRDRTVFDVTGPEFVRGTAPRTALLNGDRITVFGITSPERDAVSISGNVWAGGRIGFRKGVRISQVVREAGGLKSDTYLDEVRLTRRLADGTDTILRLRLLDTLGRAEPDLELRDGDDIHIYSVSEFRPERYVTVGGAVNRGGKTGFIPGLTLRQAILEAGGLQESALLTEVEIARMPVDRSKGQQAQVFRVPIDSTYLFERGPDGKYLGPPGVAARARGTPDVYLLPYDQVNVLRQTDWEVPASVSVTGEVKFPGAYAITQRDERIADVIKRAGGLTDRAYADAFVYRRAITQDELESRRRLLERVNQDRAYGVAVERLQAGAGQGQAAQQAAGGVAADAGAAVQAALTRALQLEPETDERIAVDLRRVMDDPSRADNFRLRPGDQLVVPSYRAIVTVRGFVNAPISVPYRSGASLTDYVSAAGGSTRNADITRSFVQQPNGAIESYHQHRWWGDGVPTPRAGSIIVVPPREVKVERQSNTPWTAILATLASIATGAAAIIAVSK